MNWLEITGVIAIGVLSLLPIYFIYHVIRGMILAFDVTLWLIKVNKTSSKPTKVTPKIFLTVWYKHIWDLIGYNSESGVTAYHGHDGSTWRGFGSGR